MTATVAQNSYKHFCLGTWSDDTFELVPVNHTLVSTLFYSSLPTSDDASTAEQQKPNTKGILKLDFKG